MSSDTILGSQKGGGSEAACERCGKCCQNGGPTLHLVDLDMVQKGRLDWADLVTLRKGEPVYDNVRERLSLNQTEMIKIKGRGDTWACRFYEARHRGCNIYTNRPLQCRLLFCQDNQAFLQKCLDHFLDRDTLLKNHSHWLHLIRGYDQVCSFASHVWPLLKAHLNQVATQREKEQLAYIINYDRQYRCLAVEKAGLPAKWQALFFGLPLSRVVPKILTDRRCRDLK